jgi:hypothetical protein
MLQEWKVGDGLRFEDEVTMSVNCFVSSPTKGRKLNLLSYVKMYPNLNFNPNITHLGYK